MVVRSLLSQVTELLKKDTPHPKIISILNERGFDEEEINKALEFVDKTIDYVEDTVDYVEERATSGKRPDLGIEFVKEKKKKKSVKSKKEKTIKKKQTKSEKKTEVKNTKISGKPSTEIKTKIIETEIDKLFKLINEKKKIKISEAAKIINVKPEIVEGWARILEGREMIKLMYHAVGEIEMLKKEEEHAEGKL